MNWTTEDYLDNLVHQLEGLSDLCLKYDDGKEKFGLDICHKLRILLYHAERGQSKSLLHQLGKQTENFISTATIWPEREHELGHIILSQGPVYPLVKQFTRFMGQPGLNYKPHLDATDTPPQRMDLTTWWEGQVVCTAQNSYSFTRKSLVLNFANQLGGSHVDPNPILDKDANIPLLPFLKLSDDVLEWKIYSGETAIKAKNEVSPFLATARQIAHEIYLSFQTIFPEINLNKIYFDRIADYRNVGYRTYSPDELSCKCLEVISYKEDLYEIVDEEYILIDVNLKGPLNIVYAEGKEHIEPIERYFNDLLHGLLQGSIEEAIKGFKKSDGYFIGTHILEGYGCGISNEGELMIRNGMSEDQFKTIRGCFDFIQIIF